MVGERGRVFDPLPDDERLNAEGGLSDRVASRLRTFADGRELYANAGILLLACARSPERLGHGTARPQVESLSGVVERNDNPLLKPDARLTRGGSERQELDFVHPFVGVGGGPDQNQVFNRVGNRRSLMHQQQARHALTSLDASDVRRPHRVDVV